MYNKLCDVLIEVDAIDVGKKKWMKTGDSQLNALLPTLSDEEKSYLELITSEEYKKLVDRVEKYTGIKVKKSNLPSLVQLLFSTVGEVVDIEKSHKKQLEELAFNTVLSLDEFKMVEEAYLNDEVAFDVKLGEPDLSRLLDVDDEQSDDDELSDDEMLNMQLAEILDDISPEAIKRRLSNLFTSGGAVNKLYLFNVVSDKLKQIDKDLPNMYGIITSLAQLGYWVAPSGVEISAASSSDKSAGSSEVVPKDDKYVIKARAVSFPYLMHEMVKGIYEWLSLDPELGKQMQKDTLGKETEDIIVGPKLFKILINYVPSNKQYLMPLIQKKVINLDKSDVKEIFAKSNNGNKIMKDIIADAETEWEDYELKKSEYYDESVIEGKLAKKYIDDGKLNKHIYDKLVDIDKSRNKKYVDWMARAYVEYKSKLDQFDVVNDFEELLNKNKLPNDKRDIYKYKTAEDVYDVVKHYEAVKTKGEKVREIKHKDAEVVFDNDEVIIVKPKSVEASALYGANTKWCTSSDKSSYFDDYYYSKHSTLYYIIKKNPAGNKYDKIAVEVAKNGKKTFYDSVDDVINGNRAKSILIKLGVPF